MSIQNNVILTATDIGLEYKVKDERNRPAHYKALTSVSFELHQGEKLGILGRNGCGKSSLLRILASIIEPSSGQIDCGKSVTRALLTLGLGFQADLSGRDNATLSIMLQGKSKKYAMQRLSEINDFAELGDFFDRPVKTYSSGMRARLGFATALQSEVDILLIDEVLSVGDAHFQTKAEKALKSRFNSMQTIVFVSHSAVQVNSLCDRALWIENGVVQSIGSASDVSKDYRGFIQSLNGK